MMSIGVLLLAAATTGDWVDGKPHVGGMQFYRHNVVGNGPGGHGHGHGAGGMAGADASMGAGGAGRRFPVTTSQVAFTEPPGLTIGWQAGGAPGMPMYLDNQLTAGPQTRYNFRQGYIYRLKLGNIPGRSGLALYPTLEVAPSTPATDAYLSHNPIPAQFTEEDFDQVAAGNFVTKVIYLPEPKYQEIAILGVETVVSTRLEPGVDPILEADRRGTILMIVRLGGINLEMNNAVGGAVVGGVGGYPVGDGGAIGGYPAGGGVPVGGGYPMGGGVPAGSLNPATPVVGTPVESGANAAGQIPTGQVTEALPMPPPTATEAPSTAPATEGSPN